MELTFSNSRLIFLLLYSICAQANACLPNESTVYPHATDCEKYIYCNNGVPTVGTCPDGQVFDHRGMCLPASEGLCYQQLKMQSKQMLQIASENENTALTNIDGSTTTPTTPTTTDVVTTPSCGGAPSVDYRRSVDFAPWPTTPVPLTTSQFDWPLCTDGIIWLLPDPNDPTCEHFLLCVYGTTTRELCPPGYLFNSTLLECTPKKDTKCWPQRSCSRIELWTTPDPSDCRFFKICVFGKITQETCPPDFEFNPHALECIPKAVAGCSVIPDKPIALSLIDPSRISFRQDTIDSHIEVTKFQCPHSFGNLMYFVEDPEDCRRYYLCYFGRSTLLKCPKEFCYSTEFKSCLPKHQVECQHRRT